MSDAPIAVHFSKRKSIGYALACPAVFAFGLWLMSWMGAETSFRSSAIGWACVIVATLGELWVIAVLFRRRPALIIGLDGVTDDSSWFSIGFVSYSEMTAAGIARYKGIRYLGIAVVDSFDERVGPVRRWVMEKNRELIGYPITIAQLGLDVSVETQLANLELFRSARAGLRRPDAATSIDGAR